MDEDVSMTGSLTRSDERYISQGFAVINKNLDHILARLDVFEKKIDTNAHRTDVRIGGVEDDFRELTARLVKIEAFLKIGAIIGGFAVSILSGILINNWNNLTHPSTPIGYSPQPTNLK